MPGPLLCGGKLADFRQLGAIGRTVWSAARQIRRGVSRQLSDADAEMLAIPQVNEAGDGVDWYAPVAGPVVPWSAMNDMERDQCSAALRGLRGKLIEHSRSMLAAGAHGDAETFAKLVANVPMIPDASHIYLVGGKPVLTFWGFHPLIAPRELDILGDLPARSCAAAPSAAAPPGFEPPGFEPGSPPVAPVRRPWWQWLAWLLGASLALVLLSLLLRGWGLTGPRLPPTDPVISFPKPELAAPSVPTPSLPNLSAPESRNLQGISPAMPGGSPPPPVPSTPPGREGGSGSGLAPEGDPAPAPHPQPAGMPSPQAPSPPAPAGQIPATAPPAPQAPSAAPAAPAGLTIPDSAVTTGSVDFLNGHWRSRTSLMDSQTGRPLEIEYEFRKGKGTSTIRRSDGAACQAPMGARMTGGRLELDQTAPAACPDGTSFGLSRVECDPGPEGLAKCRGIHENGGGFLVDIIK
jgi:hypothetical protein